MKVYVAGPLFGSGRSTENLHRALTVAEVIRDLGHFPFVPHLYHTWDCIFPHSDVDYWLDMDKEWLHVCDRLVVIPGLSPGSRKEEDWALEVGIPRLLLHFPPTSNDRSSVLRYQLTEDLRKFLRNA